MVSKLQMYTLLNAKPAIQITYTLNHYRNTYFNIKDIPHFTFETFIYLHLIYKNACGLHEVLWVYGPFPGRSE